MIIKKMYKLLKDSKNIFVHESETQKFISDGHVMADITNEAPEWTVKDIAIAMDIDEDSIGKYRMETKPIDSVLCSRLKNHCKLPIAIRCRYSLNMDGITIQPFILEDGKILLCDMKLLSVFGDIHNKVYRYYYNSGEAMIFIFVDRYCVGIVCPLRVNLQALKDFATEIATAAALSQTSGFYDAGGQIEME